MDKKELSDFNKKLKKAIEYNPKEREPEKYKPPKESKNIRKK